METKRQLGFSVTVDATPSTIQPLGSSMTFSGMKMSSMGTPIFRNDKDKSISLATTFATIVEQDGEEKEQRKRMAEQSTAYQSKRSFK